MYVALLMHNMLAEIHIWKYFIKEQTWLVRVWCECKSLVWGHLVTYKYCQERFLCPILTLEFVVWEKVKTLRVVSLCLELWGTKIACNKTKLPRMPSVMCMQSFAFWMRPFLSGIHIAPISTSNNNLAKKSLVKIKWSQQLSAFRGNLITYVALSKHKMRQYFNTTQLTILGDRNMEIWTLQNMFDNSRCFPYHWIVFCSSAFISTTIRLHRRLSHLSSFPLTSFQFSRILMFLLFYVWYLVDDKLKQ